jgi:hemerythrin-like domain-containing protein
VFNLVSEMQKLGSVIGDLQDKLSALKEANNNNVKEKIDAQNCAENFVNVWKKVLCKLHRDL